MIHEEPPRRFYSRGGFVFSVHLFSCHKPGDIPDDPGVHMLRAGIGPRAFGFQSGREQMRPW